MIYSRNIALIIFMLSTAVVNSESVLIQDITILDGKNNEPFVGNVLIDDNKISQVSTSSLRGDLVINGTGKILTPGIISTDTEIGIVEIGALSVTRDDSSNLYQIGFSIYDAFNPNSVLIPWNRSNGITSTLTLPQNTNSPIGGLGSFFVLDSSLEISGSKDVVMIGRVGGSGSESRAETFAIIEDLLEFASSIDSSDMKTYKDIAEIIDGSPIAETMDLHPRDLKALHKLVNDELPLIIKANRASDLLKLIKLKEEYDLNLIIMGAQEAGLVASRIAESKIPLIINPINNIPESFDELGANIELAGKLEDLGITLMFNAPRDHNYHLIRQGAGVAVANGMSYAGALKALTLSPVEVFKLGNRGQIAPGKIADLIIWDADPLEPSSMPEKVFINGEDIDLTSRMSRLTERYTKNKEKPNGYRN
ncbi:MAG: amidohydrolase [SAR86 cluster bacterium]|uniref:Amidohydrolase n=1 Tax=SAR86 cluster bacterium TaxID=2030880 RepID=A0A520MVE5_9GAMM|nr:MAG: amidohydrolase [SAR86 cluster bacterium]|tara:strand:+ start:621 stop:1889 length:1269 start_codon:yes stop_codon:yes gene_type:complete